MGRRQTASQEQLERQKDQADNPTKDPMGPKDSGNNKTKPNAKEQQLNNNQQLPAHLTSSQ